MKLIGRYMRREILGAVAFVLLGFLALFAFFDFISEVEDVGRGGYKLQHAIIYVLLGLPNHAYELMPIAALIGTIYALAQFVSHSEFTAMRVAGLGRAMALRQIVKIGLIFAGFTLVLGEVVTPGAETLAQRVRLTAMGTSVANKFRSGLWIKDTARDAHGQIERTRFVNIAQLMPDTSLQQVRVFEFDPQFRLRQILTAATGRFLPPDSWELNDVRETRLIDSDDVEKTMLIHAEQRTLPQLVWRSELNPDLLGVLLVDPERMSAHNLAQYVSYMRANQQRADRYEIAMWKKIVYPIAVIVMMMLALPFGYLQARAGGIGYKVFAGIMIGILFHFMNGLFSHLGMLNTWPAWLAASVPSAVALLVALAMLGWVDRAR
ncbi:MAG: LPS export ABC transporter permease LptG [Burkholderiaceae bacterium]